MRHFILLSLLILSGCGWGSERAWRNPWGKGMGEPLCKQYNTCHQTCEMYGNCGSEAPAVQGASETRSCELYGNCE